MKNCWLFPLVIVGLALWLNSDAPAQGPEPKEVQAVVDKAIAFLKTRQNADGSFVPKLGGPGVTGLVTAGLIKHGKGPDDPLVARSLKYLETQVKKDGGVYDQGLANYTTCVSLMAFQEANNKGQYDTVIKNATRFIKSLQDDGDAKDPRHGGVGYTGKERPDLSNTQFFVEALIAAGVPKDDPAIQRALKFISRCQNLPGETNDQPFAKKTSPDDKGGFTYNPVPRDKDPNATPDGGLRSLGGMTYAGLKSFLHAGVTKDDPRVQAAIGWVRRHYTVDENPGQKQSGLYYYYHTFGKAMAAWDEDIFVDAKGVKHDWRRELFEALKKRQNADGSWSNPDKSYQENNPELASAFALLTLSYCQKGKR